MLNYYVPRLSRKNKRGPQEKNSEAIGEASHDSHTDAATE